MVLRLEAMFASKYSDGNTVQGFEDITEDMIDI